MKALAWYTVIFNALIIIALILTAVRVIPPAPFTAFEDILWIIFTLPVIVLGILVIRERI
ncbi:unnamed protein product [marine sediment metagenome]|uniref:Uncharacterized protein n=1 Tax=marine sediment metagenome TaxID=412755 RepID=X1GCC6_9ZZZZ